MKHKFRQHWPLLAVVILAILLRLPLLNGSFWMDEAAQALESARSWSEQLQIKDDFQPPLLHLIVALAMRIDDSEWWLRTWGALIPGILTIIGSYVVALEVGKWVFKSPLVRLNTKLNGLNRHTILLASLTALLLATSSFHILYSQELRQYSLPAMWGIWSWWVLIKTSAITTGSRQWWAWGSSWVVLSVLGLYSSYLYPFLLISQVVWIASRLIRQAGSQQYQTDPTISPWRKKSPNFSHSTIRQASVNHSITYTQHLNTIWPQRLWLILGLLIILAFLPWLPSFRDQLHAGQVLRLSLPGWETVVSTPQLKALALVGGKFLFGVADITPNPDFVIYTLMFFGLLGVCSYVSNLIGRHPEPTTPPRREKSSELVEDPAEAVVLAPRLGAATSKLIEISRSGYAKAILLILMAFLLPLLTAWLASFIVPVLQPKRVLYLLPFWYLGLSLLITVVLTTYQTWQVKIWPTMLLGLLLILNLGSTNAYWSDATLQRENWHRAWLEVNQTYGTHTPKLFLFDGPFASWAWYDRQYSNFANINNFSFTGGRTADYNQASSILEVASNHYTHPTIIYFDYLTDLTDPNRLVLTELARQGYQPAEVLDYPNIGFVRVFRK